MPITEIRYEHSICLIPSRLIQERLYPKKRDVKSCTGILRVSNYREQTDGGCLARGELTYDDLEMHHIVKLTDRPVACGRKSDLPLCPASRAGREWRDSEKGII